MDGLVKGQETAATCLGHCHTPDFFIQVGWGVVGNSLNGQKSLNHSLNQSPKCLSHTQHNCFDGLCVTLPS